MGLRAWPSVGARTARNSLCRLTPNGKEVGDLCPLLGRGMNPARMTPAGEVFQAGRDGDRYLSQAAADSTHHPTDHGDLLSHLSLDISIPYYFHRLSLPLSVTRTPPNNVREHRRYICTLLFVAFDLQPRPRPRSSRTIRPRTARSEADNRDRPTTNKSRQ